MSCFFSSTLQVEGLGRHLAVRSSSYCRRTRSRSKSCQRGRAFGHCSCGLTDETHSKASNDIRNVDNPDAVFARAREHL